MSKASKQEIIIFSQKFEKCLEDLGNNQLAIDSAELHNLVYLNQDATWGFVELYCFMARDKPIYIMTAYIVALVYETAFGDNSLKKLVLEQAELLNAIEYIMNIKTS